PAGRLMKQARAGCDLNPFQRRKVGRVVLESLREPVSQNLRWHAVELIALPSFMRHPPHCFLPNQARFRIQPVGPAAFDVARQLQIIRRGIKASETEAEAVLATGGSMACAGVTTTDIERSNQFVSEAGWLRRVEPTDRDMSPYLLTTGRNYKVRRPVSLRNQNTVAADNGHSRI